LRTAPLANAASAMTGTGTSKTEVRVNCIKSGILTPEVDYLQRVPINHR
jgi:hypothetical protein